MIKIFFICLLEVIGLFAIFYIFFLDKLTKNSKLKVKSNLYKGQLSYYVAISYFGIWRPYGIKSGIRFFKTKEEANTYMEKLNYVINELRD